MQIGHWLFSGARLTSTPASCLSCSFFGHSNLKPIIYSNECNGVAHKKFTGVGDSQRGFDVLFAPLQTYNMPMIWPVMK